MKLVVFTAFCTFFELGCAKNECERAVDRYQSAYADCNLSAPGQDTVQAIVDECTDRQQQRLIGLADCADHAGCAGLQGGDVTTDAQKAYAVCEDTVARTYP